MRQVMVERELDLGDKYLQLVKEKNGYFKVIIQNKDGSNTELVGSGLDHESAKNLFFECKLKL